MTSMIDPAVASGNPAEPARPPGAGDRAADDLGKMWGEERDDGPPREQGMEDGTTAPDSDRPRSRDPSERREIGEAVADLDNPPADDAPDRPAADPAGGEVTGSWP